MAAVSEAAESSLPSQLAKSPLPSRWPSRHDKSNISHDFLSARNEPSKPSSTKSIPESQLEERPSESRTPNTISLSRKKVGFAQPADDSDASRSSQENGGTEPALNPHSPSAGRKPAKSILKGRQSNASGLTSKLLAPHHYISFAAMLQAIVEQLAGGGRGDRLEAYVLLVDSLKASDDLADPKALKDKMGLLLEFILRDVCQKIEGEHSLAVHALLLLSALLRLPQIGASGDINFGTSFVNHACQVLQELSTPRDVAVHVMHALANQRFPSKVMSGERTGKLVTVLFDVDSIIKGKSIVVSRINVYRNLLRHSPSHLAAHPVWLHNLFTDMISSIEEIRTEALTFGLEASYALGDDPNISRAVTKLFDEQDGEGLTHAKFYAERMKALVPGKKAAKHGEASCVPQIWSIIVLFLRGKPQLYRQWPHWTLFLNILQLCLNTSNFPTRKESNFAWNRFVYAVCRQESTKNDIIKLLPSPISEQLKTRKPGSVRDTVLGSACNLLYYTLKPGSNSAQLDSFWQRYVVLFVGHSLNPASFNEHPTWARQNLLDGCRILRYLFDSSFQRPWDSERSGFNRASQNVLPTELPALDTKWLRNKSGLVFEVLSPILQKLYWDLSHDTDAFTLWTTYIDSIAAAARKEVKVSNDTMIALASIFGFLQSIWRTGPSNIVAAAPVSESREDFLKSFERLVAMAVQGLGLLPFTQRELCMGIDDFMPVATPSSRLDRQKLKGDVRTPLHHLVLMLTGPSPGLEYDEAFQETCRSILAPFFAVHRSDIFEATKFGLDLQSLLAEDSDASRSIWCVIADCMTVVVDETMNGRDGGSPHVSIGKAYRGITHILERGLTLSPQELLPQWELLFKAVVAASGRNAGVSGSAIAVLEPLASTIVQYSVNPKDAPSDLGLSYYCLILNEASYPRDRRALDGAHRQIWGRVKEGPKHEYDPYTSLYIYVQRSLSRAFMSYEKVHINKYSDMIAATTDFLGRCPQNLRFRALSKIQLGISVWVADTDKLLSDANLLSQQIMSLWDVFCNSIEPLQAIYGCQKALSELEPLLQAGFESSRKPVVNRTIKMWNSTFGISGETFEYPRHLLDKLLQVRTIVDIQLPFVPQSSLNEVVSEQRQAANDFVESQEESVLLATPSLPPPKKDRRGGPRLSDSLRARLKAKDAIREHTPDIVILNHVSSSPVGGKRAREDTVENSNKKTRKHESTPKFRHQDSQIQFEVVDSSPLVDEIGTSQLLTERQKEVKERQVTEVLMFKDFHPTSSPKLNVADDIAESELPSYRSSSKSRRSSSILRKTTTPMPEEDAFVASSPTPKRSGSGTVDPPVPTSSPPVAPEITRDVESIDLISIDEHDLPFSPGEAEVYPSTEMTKNNMKAPKITSNPPDPKTSDSTTPTIAHVGNSVSPTAKAYPSGLLPQNASPPAIDCKSYSLSPQRDTGTDDIFEDAVSSPRKLANSSVDPLTASFPDMDDGGINDSSLLRIEKAFDHPAEALTAVSVSTPRRSLKAAKESARKSRDSSPSIRKAVLKNAATSRQSVAHAEASTPMAEQPPSPPSVNIAVVINTTTSTTQGRTGKRFVPDNDDDCIEVDPKVYELASPQPKKRKAGDSPAKGSSQKKRRGRPSRQSSQLLQLDVTSQSPVTDDLSTPQTAMDQSKQKSTPKTRSKRERSSQRLSRRLNQIPTLPAQTSMQESTGEVRSTENLAKVVDDDVVFVSAGAVERIKEKADGPKKKGKDIISRQALVEVSNIDINKAKDSVKDTRNSESSCRETPDERTGGVPGVVGSPERDHPMEDTEDLEVVQQNREAESSAAGKTDVNEPIEPDAGVSPCQPPEEISQLVPSASASLSSTPSASPWVPLMSTFQEVKQKLTELTTNISFASFSRDQVNMLEDMFMDAKVSLYSAARRGREARGA